MSQRDHMSDQIEKAAALLRAGKLVAFPTETVYGLGADATDDHAVAAIFEAKGRPSFNPLIIHLPDRETAESLVDFDPLSRSLADALWPGPFTLVLPRKADSPVSLLASAGLETLAVRVPAHDLAHQLLAKTGKPIAAPSANPSGKISPTTAAHVRDGLGDKLAMILDGGPAVHGLESTVVAVRNGDIHLLRPGSITRDMLEKFGPVISDQPDPEAPSSPGQLLSHYAPDKPIRLNADQFNDDEAALTFGAPGPFALSDAGDLTEAAANLFRQLRAADASPLPRIAVSPIPHQGLGEAINDRLKRAAADK